MSGVGEDKRSHTELVLENEALRRSNEALERFAYVAAHDLRAPLRHIGCFSELLQEKAELLRDEESVEWLSLIQTSIGRMARLTDQLLEHARMGAAEPQFEQVELMEICREAVEPLRWNEQPAPSIVSFDVSGVALANPIYLRSLVQNLVENALRYASVEEPQVRVAVARGVDSWTLSVQDNGPGIAKEDQQRVFEPFTKLGPSSSGSGLGLSICSHVVRAHGGSIRAESESGGGCCILATFPAREELG